MMLREARPDDAAAIAHVQVETWRTTYRGIVPQRYLDTLSVEWRAQTWERILDASESSHCAFAVQADEVGIVGFANGGPERNGDPVYTGELYAIYILDAFHGLGFGKRLVQAVAERLQAQGHSAMLLWVLSDNPARRFYESLGGQLLRFQPIEIGGASLQEAAYGWPRIHLLSRGMEVES